MSGFGAESLHGEEQMNERFKYDNILFEANLELEQEDRELREQELVLQELSEHAPEVQTLHEGLLRSIENLNAHCHQLETIRLAATEIHISLLLSHALTLLLTSQIGDMGNQKLRKADAVLVEVQNLAFQDDKLLNNQTMAKKMYVNGVLAEMAGGPVQAELYYIKAVMLEPSYRKLRRVAKFLDRNPNYAGETEVSASDIKRTSTWLFRTLEEITGSKGELGPLDQFIISQRYASEPKQGRGQSSQQNVEDGKIHTADNVASAASSQMTPSKEAGARHSAPRVRKLSSTSGPNLAESAPPSDTPLPNELMNPSKSLNQATVLRNKLHRLDTSGSRTSSAGSGPGSPLIPSPLRIVSVNDVTIQNENPTKSAENTTKML